MEAFTGAASEVGDGGEREHILMRGGRDMLYMYVGMPLVLLLPPECRWYFVE